MMAAPQGRTHQRERWFMQIGGSKMIVLAMTLLAVVAGSSLAKADSFTASTSGIFTSASAASGNGTNSVIFGDPTCVGNCLVLTFNGSLSGTFNSPTNFSFGDILGSVSGQGAVISN